MNMDMSTIARSMCMSTLMMESTSTDISAAINPKIFFNIYSEEDSWHGFWAVGFQSMPGFP